MRFNGSLAYAVQSTMKVMKVQVGASSSTAGTLLAPCCICGSKVLQSSLPLGFMHIFAHPLQDGRPIPWQGLRPSILAVLALRYE